MTGKRMKKLLMARGVARDTADFILRHIRINYPDGTRYSHEDMIYKAQIEVVRYKKHERT